MKYFNIASAFVLMLAFSSWFFQEENLPSKTNYQRAKLSCEIKDIVSPRNNLIRYFPFTSGTNPNIVLDKSFYQANAQGSNIAATTDLLNRTNNALSFAGGAYVETTGLNGLITNEMTISVWVKANRTSGNRPIAVGEGVVFLLEDGDTKIFTNTTTITIEPSNNENRRDWRHLVLVCKSGASKIYENGIEIGSSNDVFGNILPTSYLRFGNQPGTNNNFDGKLDEILVYNRALTVSEVQTLYNSYSPIIINTELVSNNDCNNVQINLANSELGITYRLRNESTNMVVASVDGNGSDISLQTGNLNQPTNFSVIAEHNQGACLGTNITLDTTLTITPLITGLTPTFSYNNTCNSITTITIPNTQKNVTYQLVKSGTLTTIGAAQEGNDGSIDLLLPANSISNTTVVGIRATNLTNGCSTLLDNTITVEPNSINTNLNVRTSYVNCGATTNVLVEDSEANVSYQLKYASNGNSIGSVIDGDGSIISIPFPTNILTKSTEFVVEGTNKTTGCKVDLSNRVFVNPQGIATNNGLLIDYGNPCNSSVNVDIINSQLGISYQLVKINGGEESVGSIGTGNGTTINIAVPDNKIDNTGSIFKITANDIANGCQVTLDSIFTIFPNQARTDLGVEIDYNQLCENTINVRVNNSETGIDYQLQRIATGQLVGSKESGNGNTISLSYAYNLSGSNAFKVLATNSKTNCIITLDTTFTLYPSFVDTTLTNLVDYGSCSSNAVINVASSQNYVVYDLKNLENNSLLNINRIGDGGTISLGVPTNQVTNTGTRFIVVAKNINTGCELEFEKVHRVYPSNLATDKKVTVTYESNCGNQLLIRIVDSQLGVEYQMQNNTSLENFQMAQIGTGNDLDFTFINPLTTSTTFRIKASNPNTPCENILDTLVTLHSNDVDGSLTLQPQYIGCSSLPRLEIINSQSFVNYQLQKNSGNGDILPEVKQGTGSTIFFEIPSAFIDAGGTEFKVLATNMNTGCALELTNKQTIFPLNLQTDLAVAVDYSGACSNPETVQIFGSQNDVRYEVKERDTGTLVSSGNGNGGLLTINISSEVLSTPKEYEIEATSTLNSCNVTLDTILTLQPSTLTNRNIEIDYSTFCSDDTKVRIINSQVGVSYFLENINNTAIFSETVNGTGFNIELTVPNGTSLSSEYNIIARNQFNDCATSLDTVITTFNKVANTGLNPRIEYGDICFGDNQLSLQNSQSNFKYQIREVSTLLPIGSQVKGNSNAPIFFNLPYDAVSRTTNCEIVGVDTLSGCQTVISTSFMLESNSTITNLNAQVEYGSVCTDSSIVRVFSTEANVSYQLLRKSNTFRIPNIPLPGNNNALNFTVKNQNLSDDISENEFEILTFNNITGCEGKLDTTLFIAKIKTINDQPELVPLPSDSCNVVSNIQVKNSEIGVRYDLYNTNNTFDRISFGYGINDAINLSTGVVQESSSFTIIAVDTATNCRVTLQNVPDIIISENYLTQQLHRVVLEATSNNCNQFTSVVLNPNANSIYTLYQVNTDGSENRLVQQKSGNNVSRLELNNTLVVNDSVILRLEVQDQSTQCSANLGQKVFYGTNTQEVEITFDNTNGVLRSLYTNADSYQWYFRKTSTPDVVPQPLYGQTQPNYTPHETGFFLLEVTKDQCTWRSKEDTVTITAITQLELQNHTKVFPNPASEYLTIESNSQYNFKSIEVIVVDASGKQVSLAQTRKNQSKLKLTIDRSWQNLANGNYQLIFKTEKGIFFIKSIVKN